MEEETKDGISSAVTTGLWRWTWGILTWGLITLQCMVIITNWVYPTLIPEKYLYLPLVAAIFPLAVKILGLIVGLVLITLAKGAKHH